ncbi:MAG: NUDIX hydrolase [Chloroflexi bacterium]|nr:NUDIX hydrolase [Chloroflexota bacterium]
MYIKRVKPHQKAPYWVAPGGGVEADDETLKDALIRELGEELGARVAILDHGFVLRHNKANKDLEEHFFICKLLDFDVSQRHGPEFNDPARGQYIPDEVALTGEAIAAIDIKTVELRDWLLLNLDTLCKLA